MAGVIGNPGNRIGPHFKGIPPADHPRRCVATTKYTKKRCTHWALTGQDKCKLHMPEPTLAQKAIVAVATTNPQLAAIATKRFKYSEMADPGPLKDKLVQIEQEFENDDLRLSLKSVEAIVEYKMREAVATWMKVESGALDLDPAKHGDAKEKNAEIRRIAREAVEYETKNHAEFMERSAKIEILRKEALKKDTAKNYAVIQLLAVADKHFGQSQNPDVLKLYEEFKKSVGALGHLDHLGMKVNITI